MKTTATKTTVEDMPVRRILRVYPTLNHGGIGACREGRAWVRNHCGLTLRQAWARCNNPAFLGHAVAQLAMHAGRDDIYYRVADWKGRHGVKFFFLCWKGSGSQACAELRRIVPWSVVRDMLVAAMKGGAK